MKLTRPAVVLATVLLVLVAAAIGIEALVSAGTSGPGAGGYAVVVMRDGQELARLSLDDLRGLGVVRVTVEGKTEEGPTLLSVLQAAGVAEFERVHISGMGIRDDGEIVLSHEQITDEVLLDIANRGTVKVVGPGIAWEDRVRDITEIVVE